MTEIAILGAGLMGHALALVYALGGHNVRLTDSNAETLARAPARWNLSPEGRKRPGRGDQIQDPDLHRRGF